MVVIAGIRESLKVAEVLRRGPGVEYRGEVGLGVLCALVLTSVELTMAGGTRGSSEALGRHESFVIAGRIVRETLGLERDEGRGAQRCQYALADAVTSVHVDALLPTTRWVCCYCLPEKRGTMSSMEADDHLLEPWCRSAEHLLSMERKHKENAYRLIAEDLECSAGREGRRLVEWVRFGGVCERPRTNMDHESAGLAIRNGNPTENGLKRRAATLLATLGYGPRSMAGVGGGP